MRLPLLIDRKSLGHSRSETERHEGELSPQATAPPGRTLPPAQWQCIQCNSQGGATWHVTNPDDCGFGNYVTRSADRTVREKVPLDRHGVNYRLAPNC